MTPPTTRRTESAGTASHPFGPFPTQRRAEAAAHAPEAASAVQSPAPGLSVHARRAFAAVCGMRTLRPVPARVAEPYGESDGQ